MLRAQPNSMMPFSARSATNAPRNICPTPSPMARASLNSGFSCRTKAQRVAAVSSAPVRCAWPGTDPLYVAYHDEEWGVPEFDHRALYEKLVLDGFQAGLSWITILRKRENFRRAFGGFAPETIARYGDRQIGRLLKDEGIVRRRAKIDGAIASARAWLHLMETGAGFGPFLW